MRRSNLPDSITLRTGEVLKAVIGGHLEQKPFLTVEHSGVDVKKNGWMSDLPPGKSENSLIIAEAKRRGLKYRRVSILPGTLRGKLDLHNRPYTASVWIFVQVESGNT